MPRNTYTAQFKAKLVIEVLEGEKTLDAIAAENQINPNMLRNWKKEFLENASRTFEDSTQRAARKREKAYEKEKQKMLRTIGQLTLERDFLQDCFRKTGQQVPKLGEQ